MSRSSGNQRRLCHVHTHGHMLHTRWGEIVIVTANLPLSSNKFLSRSLTVVLSLNQSGLDVLAMTSRTKKTFKKENPFFLKFREFPCRFAKAAICLMLDHMMRPRRPLVVGRSKAPSSTSSVISVFRVFAKYACCHFRQFLTSWCTLARAFAHQFSFN